MPVANDEGTRSPIKRTDVASYIPDDECAIEINFESAVVATDTATVKGQLRPSRVLSEHLPTYFSHSQHQPYRYSR